MLSETTSTSVVNSPENGGPEQARAVFPGEVILGKGGGGSGFPFSREFFYSGESLPIAVGQRSESGGPVRLPGNRVLI